VEEVEDAKVWGRERMARLPKACVDVVYAEEWRRKSVLGIGSCWLKLKTDGDRG